MKTANGWTGLLGMISRNVWIVLFSSVLVFCVLMGYIQSYEDPQERFSRKFFQSVWRVTSTLLQKGPQDRPAGYVLALTNALWMLSALIISQIFGGMVLTNLLLRKADKIDSIEDLDASKNIKPILEYQSSIFSAFKEGEPQIYRSIYRKVLRNRHQSILTYKQMGTIGMENVWSGSFALITDGMGLRYFLCKRHSDGLPCNYRLAKELLWPLWKVIAFRKNFPKKVIHRVNKILRSTYEAGWLQQKMMKEFSGYTECLSDGTIEVQSLQLEHIQGTFIVWALGCLISTIVLIVEICWKKCT